MPLLYLVRHGRIAEHASDDADPELGPKGHEQAQTVARELQLRLPRPLPILSSPLLRCLQTAQPLAAIWDVEMRIEPRVIEVPSPRAPGLKRRDWLDGALHWTWAQARADGERLEPGYAAALDAWRARLREAVLEQGEDAVIFMHYVPINALAGFAGDDERITVFQPDNASVTVIETDGSSIKLLERGRERGTRVV